MSNSFEIVLSVFVPAANAWFEGIRDPVDIQIERGSDGHLFRGAATDVVMFVSASGGNVWKIEKVE